MWNRRVMRGLPVGGLATSSGPGAPRSVAPGVSPTAWPVPATSVLAGAVAPGRGASPDVGVAGLPAAAAVGADAPVGAGVAVEAREAGSGTVAVAAGTGVAGAPPHAA